MQHCHPILPPVCRVQAQEIALREKGKALTDEDVIQVSFRFFFVRPILRLLYSVNLCRCCCCDSGFL